MKDLFSFTLSDREELVSLRDVDREGVGCFIIFPAVSAAVFEAQVSLSVIFDVLFGLGLLPALQTFPII